MRLGVPTEALALASARRPWRVVAVWLIALIGSIIVIATLLSSALTSEVNLTNNPESERADAFLEKWRGPDNDVEIVIVQSDQYTVDDRAFEDKVNDLFRQIMALKPDITAGGTSYYVMKDESFVSADRHTTIIPFVMAGDQETANDNIDAVLPITAPEQQGQFRVLTAGHAALNHEVQDISVRDLQKGEAIGVPIALIILVLVFGALTAALVPLMLGFVSIVVALAITALLGQEFKFSFFVTNVITMAGLAVGIDYSLFIISRFREERARGFDKYEAIHSAGSTATRAVVFSGVTVVFALLGLLLVPSMIFRSLGAGAICVVVIAVLASVTLLPAILSLMGDHVNSLRVPLIGGAIDRINFERPGGFWERITRAVMRYPLLSIVLSGGVLIALAVPYLDLASGSGGVQTLPHNTASYEAYKLLQDEFNFGLVSPIEVVVHDADVRRPEVVSAVRQLRDTIARDSLYGRPTVDASPDNSTAVLSVAINADPTSEIATNKVRELRDKIIPAAFQGVQSEVLVTGQTARDIDYIDTTAAYTPFVFIFVLGLSFVLLTVVFRSLVVPLKAIVMNLMSVGASYGALVLVFQKGVGNEILGFQQVDSIEAWVPLWTFSILFGLSMDYHVFLLSRIRERFNKTGDNKESVAFGVRSTGGIITGAALIMASVFGGVAFGDLVMFQQMGFGLAIAVLLDATIVRLVLVPSTMELLGRANWYLPRILWWLPEVHTEAREPQQSLRPGTETG